MVYTGTRRSPVATISKPLPVGLSARPSESTYLGVPSIQLGPSRSDVLMRLRILMTNTRRPSSPRVSMFSVSMEIPNV